MPVEFVDSPARLFLRKVEVEGPNCFCGPEIPPDSDGVLFQQHNQAIGLKIRGRYQAAFAERAASAPQR